MTGKQLKEFADQVHDESLIEIREQVYGSWIRDFQMQATYIYTVSKITETDTTE